MKILMLTCNSGLQDGINRHILAVAPTVNRLPDCEVAVCTTFAAGELNAALEREGVRAFALGLPHGHDVRTWWRLRKVMRDFKPDVIHAHVLGLFARWYLELFHPLMPIVYTCHGITDVESGVRTVSARDRMDAISGKIAFHRAVRRRQTTVFISEGVKRFKGAEDAPVIYNPVAFDEKQTLKDTNVLRTEQGLATDTPVIGTACRISLPKQPSLFVDVMCRVLRAVPRAHAVVCGTAQDAELMRSRQQQVGDAGVTVRFHWLGYRKDAPQITRELNCFVMTSATEGMPTALLEAMAVKTPIAFMRGKGGLVDLDMFNRTEGPIAVVADQGNCDQLARGVVELVHDTKRTQENADRAFSCGKKHFDVFGVAQQLAKVYHIVTT